MKAMVCPRYGPPDVLELREVPTPTPGRGEVRVRVAASTVTAGDYRIRGLNVPTGFRTLTRLALGFRGPRHGILGTELAGVVDAVGPGVTAFRPGDDVFAYPGAAMGGYAEYAVLGVDGPVAAMPAGLTHAEAAALPFGASTALFFLREKANVRPGQRVLIYGASGGVGTAAVQVAKHLGAHVTGVCSTRNLELVRSLGADRVVDYTRDAIPPEGQRYDVVMECVGKSSYALWKPALERDGAFIMLVGGLPDYLRMLRVNATGGARIIAGTAPERQTTLRAIRGMAESGALRPVIDRRWPLAEAVEAHRYAEGGHKRGSVVLEVAPVRAREHSVEPVREPAGG